jgi:1,3-beta-glucan synthase
MPLHSVSTRSFLQLIISDLLSLLLVWLRPSKQIRPPLYSIKQKKQRRWIVLKYGTIYLLVIGIFAALITVREYC